MYILKFIKIDSSPDEEFYYYKIEDAKLHFNLFRDDDSKLYSRIELLSIFDNHTQLLDSITF